RGTGITLLTLLATGCTFLVTSIRPAEAVEFGVCTAVLTYPAAFVVWVVYWTKMSRYARELKTGAVRDAPARVAVEYDEGW
ncbi:MAG TPA: hypothetical protein VH092_27915, partial [Urbifossiella sp.]|nr:hypothetical protein [Urbifossiella sp.]